MERNVKHLLLRKTNVLKARIYCEIFLSDYFMKCVVWKKYFSVSSPLKLRFFRKENLKKSTYFEERKSTRYIRGNVYIDIIVLSCLSSTKPCLRLLLNCFVQEIKSYYQSSFGNEVDFKDIINVSLNLLAKT